MQKVWKDEELHESFEAFLFELMTKMNQLIKKYSGSDDYGEYSKKEELWTRIKGSSEIETFMNTKNAVLNFQAYHR